MVFAREPDMPECSSSFIVIICDIHGYVGTNSGNETWIERLV